MYSYYKCISYFMIQEIDLKKYDTHLYAHSFLFDRLQIRCNMYSHDYKKIKIDTHE